MNKKNSNCPLVYIIVLNYNGFHDTTKCINSLLESNYKNQIIILVDNASTDNSAALLSKEFPQIKMIVSKINTGYSGGMNLGIRYALSNNSDYVLIANNDLVFEKNFLEPMVTLAESSEKIGIVSPKINQMDRKDLIFSAGLEYDILRGGTYNRFRGMKSSQHALQIRKISFADGACLLVKKDVFEKIGLLSENYFMYFEDLDFSYKVGQKLEIFFTPEAIVYHKSGAGKSWEDYSPLYYFYYTRNRFVFFKQLKNPFVFLYITLFSAANAILKSYALFKALFKKTSKGKIIRSLKSLWTGLFEGVLISMNMR